VIHLGDKVRLASDLVNRAFTTAADLVAESHWPGDGVKQRRGRQRIASRG
jgi:hypothetical protein